MASCVSNFRQLPTALVMVILTGIAILGVLARCTEYLLRRRHQ